MTRGSGRRRVAGGQPQGDVAAPRVRRHVCGRQIERFEQRGEVVAVLVDAAGRIRPLAAQGVPAAVIGEHSERSAKPATTTSSSSRPPTTHAGQGSSLPSSS